MLERLQQDKLVVAFVAEFSRGKSELINAIFFADFGQRLLPSSAGRTTMCPTELLHDRRGPPSIRLLPIETRLKEATVTEFKNYADEWVTFPLDLAAADRMAETLARVSQVKRVPVALARKYGLFSERDDDILSALERGDEEPVLVHERGVTRLTCETRARAFPPSGPPRRGRRGALTLVGVVLEFSDRRLVEPRFDRQQPERRGPRRIVQDFGRAHRRAAHGRRKQPLAEIGKENRVDELGLAARELCDERDDELVLLQALEQLLHLDVRLRVGQVLLLQPFVEQRNSGRQPPPPIGVGFETHGEVA